MQTEEKESIQFDPLVQKMYWYRNNTNGGIAVLLDFRESFINQKMEVILLPYLSVIPICKNYAEFVKELKKGKYTLLNP